MSLDVAAVRAAFPGVTDADAYLDSAATAQKPAVVLDRLRWAYTEACANVHRGVHTRSQRATDAIEAARERMAAFLGAPDAAEVVWVRGATEGLNLLAHGLGQLHLGPGDEVLVTTMEHHANLVPWQLACQRHGATLRAIPLHDDGSLDLTGLDALLTERTKILAVVHASNSLGTINPVAGLARAAHRVGALCVVDGTQMVVHGPVDVQALGVDAYVCSGHKLYGPSGIGVLWARRALLEAMPPYQGGGEMILRVTLQQSTWNEVPHKFEAGTPHIAGAIALHAALDFLEALGWDAIREHEKAVHDHAIERLFEIPGLRRIGTATPRVPLVGFDLAGVHPHDVGTILDQHGVAVRTGHHCTQPVMDHFDLAATVRASFAVHTTHDEVDRLVDGLRAVRKVFPHRSDA